MIFFNKKFKTPCGLVSVGKTHLQLKLYIHHELDNTVGSLNVEKVKFIRRGGNYSEIIQSESFSNWKTRLRKEW